MLRIFACIAAILAVAAAADVGKVNLFHAGCMCRSWPRLRQLLVAWCATITK